MRFPALGGLCAAIGVLALAAPARADGDRALSVGLGWATFSTPGKKANNQEPPAVSPDWGLSAALIYEHGISTDLSLRGELVGNTFSGGTTDKKQDAQSYAVVADAGVVFRFDVLRYVPYAFGGAGAVASTGGPLGASGLVVAIGGGLDVLVNRNRSVGVELRLASFGTDLTVVTANLRVSSRWGFF